MRWFLFLIPHLLIGILRYPLAIIAVLLFSSSDRKTLKFMKWLETIDNDLSGDSGWREEHLIGKDPLSTINRIRWLWRNGGNSVNYKVFGVTPNGPTVQVNDHRWKNDSCNAWLYRRFVKVTDKRFIDLFFGWALLGPQHGMCKYVFTVRLKTKV